MFRIKTLRNLITLAKNLRLTIIKYLKYNSHPMNLQTLSFYNENSYEFLCGYKDISLDNFLSDKDFETYQNIADEVNLNEIDNFCFGDLL